VPHAKRSDVQAAVNARDVASRACVACLEPMLSRRQLLAASPTTLPLFLALSGCKGPAVLSGPPPLTNQTQMLLRTVTAEQNLIWIYNRAMVEYSALRPALAPLLAEHRAHLTQLAARVVEPAGKKVPETVTAKPALAGTADGALVQLRAAELAAVTRLLGRGLLGSASPSLAQLYASVATSESTHVTTLTSRIEQSRAGS
jgi:hypothetical protein